MTSVPLLAPAVKPRLMSREFTTVAAATSLFFLVMGALNPLMSVYIVEELGSTKSAAGWVMSSFALSSVFLRTGFGRLGGRRGARLLVQVGTTLGIIALVVLAATASIAGTVASRIILGAAQASLMTGATVLAIDLAPEERRGEAVSYILVSFHLGLALGPLIGESLRDNFGYTRVFVGLAVLMAVALGVGSLLRYRGGDLDAPPVPFFHKQGVAPGLVAMFGIVAFVGFNSFLPLYGKSVGLTRVAPVFVVASVAIVVMRVFGSRLPDRLGPLRSVNVALGLTLVGAVLAAMWATPIGVFVAMAVMALGMALQTPSFIPVAVAGLAPHERSSAMATFTTFMDISIVATNPMVGFVADHGGYRTAFLIAGACTLVAIVLVPLVMAPAWRHGNRTPDAPIIQHEYGTTYATTRGD
jgi:MFS family permease